jgi:hypothetical protein
MDEVKSVVAANNLYITGTFAHNRFLYSYNQTMDEWIDLSKTFPYFKDGGISSAVFLEGYDKILLIGNTVNAADSIVTVLVSYDISTFRPSVVSMSPTNALSQWMISYKGMVYIGGGSQVYNDEMRYAKFYRKKYVFNKNSASSLFTLDPANLTYSLIGDIKFSSKQRGAVTNNELYVLEDANDSTQWIHKYSFEKNEWINFIELDRKFVGNGFTSYRDYIYLVGGKNKESELLVIDLKTKKHFALNMNIHALYSQAEVLNDTLYVFGGYNVNNFLDRNLYATPCAEIISLMQEAEFEEALKPK